MDPSKASYSRYWEPNLLQTVGLSLLAGSIATTVTHPIQYIKTVIQFRAEGVGLPGERFKAWNLGYNPFRIVREMHSRGGGLMQFYGGFEANLLGRLGYLLIRNTTYKIIYDYCKPEKPFNDLTFKEKMYISGFAGGLAAWATTPFTLISIRQILDSQIKKQWRRNYGKATQAINALGSEKFKGAWANILRHVVLNISLTAPFDFFHEGLYLRFGDYGFVKPTALILASIVSTIVTLPFDNARTRLMNAHSQPQRNRFNYKGIASVFESAAIFEHSKFSLWAGFTTYFAATLIYATLTVGITNSITNSIKRANGLKEWQIQ